jgi:hypothetical protein
MIVMQLIGLNLSWTALLALPAVVLIAFGFASLGMAITSYRMPVVSPRMSSTPCHSGSAITICCTQPGYTVIG